VEVIGQLHVPAGLLRQRDISLSIGWAEWASRPVWMWCNVKVKLSLCLTKHYTLHHEGVWGSECVDSHFLDLGTCWKWVVRFTPLQLYPLGKSPRYPLDRRLGGTLEPVWTTWRRENSWPYRHSNSGPSADQLVASPLVWNWWGREYYCQWQGSNSGRPTPSRLHYGLCCPALKSWILLAREQRILSKLVLGFLLTLKSRVSFPSGANVIVCAVLFVFALCCMFQQMRQVSMFRSAAT
jgi:hypothetical protein